MDNWTLCIKIIEDGFVLLFLVFWSWRMGSHIQGTNAIWLKIIIYLLVFIEPQVNSQNIDQELNVTFITNAVKKGAGNICDFQQFYYQCFILILSDKQLMYIVCLDGSPGAYYFAKGFGDGVHNWMIYLPVSTHIQICTTIIIYSYSLYINDN